MAEHLLNVLQVGPGRGASDTGAGSFYSSLLVSAEQRFVTCCGAGQRRGGRVSAYPWIVHVYAGRRGLYSATVAGDTYHFGEYELDVGRHQLHRAGEPVHVEPRALDLWALTLDRGHRLSCGGGQRN